jgi:hypothetical protein
VTGREQHGASDEAFDAAVRDAVADLEPVPDAVKAAARAARFGRGPEGSALLELVYDSAIDADLEPLGCAPVRLLSFAGGLRLELRVDTREDRREVRGWTAPVVPSEVMVRTEETSDAVTVDDDGTFRVERAARTRVSFVVDVRVDVEPRRYHSGWFVL